MRRRSSICAALLLSSCSHALPRADATASVAPAALVGSGVELYVESRSPSPPSMPGPIPTAGTSEVLVTPDRQLGVPTEMLGVLDFHSPADTEDKGFAELRARAAALGADAVIGAEFEHGEDGGLSHLSGMAVRRR